MTFDPKILNATNEERSEAFEWMRSLAIGGGPNWRKYAIVLEEWARLGASRIDVEGRDFYELCQQYRHSTELPPMVGMLTTVQAFEALKTYIKTGLLPWPSYEEHTPQETAGK